MSNLWNGIADFRCLFGFEKVRSSKNTESPESFVVAVRQTNLNEEARFSKTMKGRAALFDCEGYRYVQRYTVNKNNDNVVYWRCEFSPKLRGRCPGSCVTNGVYITMKRGPHIHEAGVPVFSSIKQRNIPH
jgi:hypothetical protein